MARAKETEVAPTESPAEFADALKALIAQYRNVIHKAHVAHDLNDACNIVQKDEGWIYNEVNLPPLPPTLTDLEPDTAVLGSEDVTMVCTGTNFTPQSVIIFAGQPEPIVFVSSTEISTVVKPTLPWGAVTVPVLVRAPDGQETEPLDFTFTEEAEEPLSRKSRSRK